MLGHTVTSRVILAISMAFLVACSGSGTDTSPPSSTSELYNTEIPAKIKTPNEIETRFYGTLEFFDGLPSRETAQKLFDRLDFSHGVEVFLNGIPATSLEAIRLGMKDLGATQPNQVIILDQLMDSNPLFLTGNTSTVYALAIFDLERDGPVVVEMPPSGPGTVNDAWFRFVTDMGVPGPDQGKGGKYLILPPDYQGETPDGYFVSQSRTYVNWLILRGFLVDGKPDSAAATYKEGLKIYPLASAEQPPAMEFITGSGRAFNTIHANNFEFYEELNHVIQKEPIDSIEPQLRGLIASVGIQKGEAFEPDARMRDLLIEAAVIGNATARAIVFQTREPEAYFYENSSWRTGFVGGSYEWLKDDGEGGRYLDARTLFFYFATVNTPAMAAKRVGVGSQYAIGDKDRDGNYLDGSKTYRLRIPADAPAKDFWSIVVYDPQTRSELQTNQPFPSKDNKRDDLEFNADGSVDLYFGPEAPAGKEKNWIETVPGKAWFSLFRLYGPLEPWFDKTWQIEDFELVE